MTTGFRKMMFLEEETILVGALYIVTMNLTSCGVEQKL